MTTVYLPKRTRKINANEIYVMTKNGLKLPAMSQKLGISLRDLARMIINQPVALSSYWQGKQEFETGICVA